MSEYTPELIRCLDGGRSPWHTVEMAAQYLNANGFSPLDLAKPFEVRRGADSSTLSVILEKLSLALGLDRAAMLDACMNGMLLSCDAAHAMHPNHPEYADPSCAPLLGRGVALKRSPRYASDAETCAVIQGLCDAYGIPLQIYMNRADLPGGSTVGSMASSLLAMPAVDIGVPILAMHSARELMAAADQDAFVKLCTAFFSAK